MHADKCYWGALEKLVAEKPHYKGKGKLTVATQKRSRGHRTVATRSAQWPPPLLRRSYILTVVQTIVAA